MTITLEGFHGTDNALVDSILSNGLRPSLLVLGIIEQKRTNTYHMLFYVE